MKIGIIGTGSIIPDFLKAAVQVEGLTMHAICGRPGRMARMQELAALAPFKMFYEDYDAMLDDTEVEAVYVAVPNHLHYDFAKRALLKNKHVILEKPFAANYGQAEELVNLALEHNLFLFEAISNQYLPNYLKIQDLVKEIGAIRIVQLNYSQYSKRYDAFKAGTILPAFDPAMSGGTLMDLNVYNIHFIMGLFGNPDRISYHANIERGIDLSGILVMDYPGFKCVAVAAKDCNAPVSINIQGDAGYIHSDSPSNRLTDFEFCPNGEAAKRYDLNNQEDRLYHELAAFRDMCLGKDYALRDRMLSQSLDVMKILDEARRQVGVMVL